MRWCKIFLRYSQPVALAAIFLSAAGLGTSGSSSSYRSPPRASARSCMPCHLAQLRLPDEIHVWSRTVPQTKPLKTIKSKNPSEASPSFAYLKRYSDRPRFARLSYLCTPSIFRILSVLLVYRKFSSYGLSSITASASDTLQYI